MVICTVVVRCERVRRKGRRKEAHRSWLDFNARHGDEGDEQGGKSRGAGFRKGCESVAEGSSSRPRDFCACPRRGQVRKGQLNSSTKRKRGSSKTYAERCCVVSVYSIEVLRRSSESIRAEVAKSRKASRATTSRKLDSNRFAPSKTTREAADVPPDALATACSAGKAGSRYLHPLPSPLVSL